jgi:uroporphyrinogen decarboxylase
MALIVAGLKREHEGQRIPVTLFTKGGGQWLEAIADTGCDALGLDWTIDIDEARQRVGERVALQGNLDPCVLYADPDSIRAAARDIITRFGCHNGHIFNLGHGIHQTVKPDHLGILVDAVHEYGFEIRQ